MITMFLILYLVYKYSIDLNLDKSKSNYINSYSFHVAGYTKNNNPRNLKKIVKNYGFAGKGLISFEYEPNNMYDHNAIKVIFNPIGHIGYVPMDKNIKFKKYLKSNFNYDIFWEINECVLYYYGTEKSFYYMSINISN